MTTRIRQAIVREARRWVGTPYHHQASRRGTAVDCAGLIRGVGWKLGLMDLDDAAWIKLAHYGRQPNPTHMRKLLDQNLVAIERQPLIGDVAWIEWRKGLPMHLAILAELDGRATIIHAWSEPGRVVEHTFDQDWQDKVAQWFEYQGVG